jgi:hypothetical protein
VTITINGENDDPLAPDASISLDPTDGDIALNITSLPVDANSLDVDNEDPEQGTYPTISEAGEITITRKITRIPQWREERGGDESKKVEDSG